MRRVVSAFFVCLVLSAPAFAADRSNVKVINQSKWDIHHMFVSPSEQEDWGPDQLEDQVIDAGANFTLNGIPCDVYDIKVVDEDGDECILEAVDICENSYWKITTQELLECEGFGE
jgi:hypothetical protein